MILIDGNVLYLITVRKEYHHRINFIYFLFSTKKKKNTFLRKRKFKFDISFKCNQMDQATNLSSNQHTGNVTLLNRFIDKRKIILVEIDRKKPVL